ncbi:acetyl-CoA synthetase-like protein [Neurospora crassa]|uniref:Carrier domain-containing protein n=1 Tax=Neurospora crassa (strain ATCC 24698 / 74-OR23-1A / CBS 708.71 / DSM 1257 / FGSC 987) TaxID=367110 RepID=Q7SC49_NEUCR|nr:hypothetical protein NCU08404 [Neurospora crassa OR74A]EAA34040.3 hypothetical protein NCU08404 [Neurospora crassa OR74A]KHE82384.1 acetyl-CoA synthetase-like protein [Neurospora crassa]|eukprot:XP_963276.3 hypothetical protein NCU08404 [Neurospora crassa OR74A]
MASPYDTLLSYAQATRQLRLKAASGLDCSQQQQVLNSFRVSYTSLSAFIQPSSKPALSTPDLSTALTHGSLRDFTNNFALPSKALDVPQRGQLTKPIVCIALPNGPVLAAVCLAVANTCTASPVNCDKAVGAEQFRADVRQTGASVILTSAKDAERLGLTGPSSWTALEGLTVLLVESDLAQRGQPTQISIRDLTGQLVTPQVAGCSQPAPNGTDDVAIILFTSGTSGTKKLVPITIQNIVAGVAFVIDSWGLTPDDVCLNMMPLFHIGGLVRNIFSPIFSGGSVICCSAFDPTLFWDVMQDHGATWYYASPSMHQMILDQAEDRPEALAKSRVRLVCNAAGGLLPALAVKLKETFNGAIVLPSYGMTECMPISTPPTNYKLDKPGTSGVAVGPELAILDWNNIRQPSDTVGRICVRGEPVFPGYLTAEGQYDSSTFTPDGWFDTGDLGRLSSDGYLFITGRSKEVINRGGEIISPFEIENAIIAAAQDPKSPIFNRVLQALSFSVRHDVLQEVVGVVLVTPPGAQRVDTRQLHQALKQSLQQVKWPGLIVYMEDVPKSNNKVLRIKLADRLGLPELTDSSRYCDVHYEATCPPPNTPLSVSISSTLCSIDGTTVYRGITALLPLETAHHVHQNPQSGGFEVYLAPKKEISDVSELNKVIDSLKSKLPSLVSGYLVPHRFHILQSPLPVELGIAPTREALESLLYKENNRPGTSDPSASGNTASQVTRIMASILSLSAHEITVDADFFDLGGDSLRAGRLLSALRSEFGLSLPIDLVFRGGSVDALSAFIDEKLASRPSSSAYTSYSDTTLCDSDAEQQARCEGLPTPIKTHSSTNPFLMVLQLLPMAILYPLRRGVHWAIFLLTLAHMERWPTSRWPFGRLVNIVTTLLFARVVMSVVRPIIGILAKWLIMGRYKEGVYPMWGWYHTRWWLTQKVIALTGQGIFRHHNYTIVWYYRLLGAKIGSGVELNDCQLGEYDLLTIGPNAFLDKCIVRPFGAEANTSMYLGKIMIGANASVGLAANVAPGTQVSDGACIGPNSCSWELNDATEANRDLSVHRAPQPHWALTLFLTMPLYGLVSLVAGGPWLLGMVGLVEGRPPRAVAPLPDIITWWAGNDRIGYHYLAVGLGVMFGPFFEFAAVMIIKTLLDLMFGKLKPSSATGRGQIERWRLDLMRTIYPNRSLKTLTGLFGQHYEMTSVILRMLGAKIGKRVYWPGTGPGITDYHLLEVGNDVVFGSRSYLVTSDGLGSEPIKIGDRAMIADRVVCLPGVTVGEDTVLGSGALTRRNKEYVANGVYVGSKGGDSLCLSTGAAPKGGDKSRVSRRNARAAQQPAQTQEENTFIESVRYPQGTNDPEEGRSTPSIPITRPVSDIPGDFTHSNSDTEAEDPTSAPAVKSTPFGRAFYLGLAPYHVYSPFTITAYSIFNRLFTALYWTAPSISTIQIINVFIARHPDHPVSHAILSQPMALFGLLTAVFAVFNTLLAFVALLITIAAKWILLGRRQPGTHSWDISPYCQRWQLLLSIEQLRRTCFAGQGVLGMLTGTCFTVAYFRALGAKIGKDCALFVNGRPSLVFTEPELLVLGDRVTVDDASLVAHINTRGKFDLNRLRVGDGAVLRTGSRLLSGAEMQRDACLLEHTLVMGGETVKEGVTVQGWPGEEFRRVGRRCVVDGVGIDLVGGGKDGMKVVE